MENKLNRTESILAHLTKDVWLLEKIFWNSSIVIYNEEFERIKTRLKKVYNKHDVDEIFPSRLDNEKARSYLEIFFKQPSFWPEEQARPKFLWLF